MLRFSEGIFLGALTLSLCGSMATAGFYDGFEAVPDGPLDGYNNWYVDPPAGSTTANLGVTVETDANAYQGNKLLRIVDNTNGLAEVAPLDTFDNPLAADASGDVFIHFAHNRQTAGTVHTNLNFFFYGCKADGSGLDYGATAFGVRYSTADIFFYSPNHALEVLAPTVPGRWYVWDVTYDIVQVSATELRQVFDVVIKDGTDNSIIVNRTDLQGGSFTVASGLTHFSLLDLQTGYNLDGFAGATFFLDDVRIDSTPIPEPASALMIVVPLLLTCRRKRC